MSILIPDKEFQRLLSLKKTFTSDFELPTENDKAYFILRTDTKESFQLNIERKNTYEVYKSKTQTAYYKEPLLRIEVDAPPHTNPDGTLIGRNHIHIYREGFGLRWAYPLQDFHDIYFKDPFDFPVLFADFCNYFNIENNFIIQGVLSCFRT